MQITRLPIVALVLSFALFTMPAAHAASKKLSPGTYRLSIAVTQGEFAGTKLTGTCTVKGSAVSYTISIPFVGNVRAKGTTTKSGSFTIKQVGGSGRATVVVNSASTKSASERFSKAQSPLAVGTWSMKK